MQTCAWSPAGLSIKEGVRRGSGESLGMRLGLHCIQVVGTCKALQALQMMQSFVPLRRVLLHSAHGAKFCFKLRT